MPSDRGHSSTDQKPYPATASRAMPYRLDRKAYERHDLIERLRCFLENQRRFAIRYDRLEHSIESGLAFVAVVAVWAI